MRDIKHLPEGLLQAVSLWSRRDPSGPQSIHNLSLFFRSKARSMEGEECVADGRSTADRKLLGIGHEQYSRVPGLVTLGMLWIQGCFPEYGRLLPYHAMVMSRPSAELVCGCRPSRRAAVWIRALWLKTWPGPSPMLVVGTPASRLLHRRPSDRGVDLTRRRSGFRGVGAHRDQGISCVMNRTRRAHCVRSTLPALVNPHKGDG
jgi:hypothetical protein